MRLALVGAFPFPHPQGSQAYFAEQARALAAAGAEATLVTYAPGPRQLRARSGPSPGKPIADAVLATRYHALCARQRFDAALAHNAEAAVAAIAVRARTGVPVVYVAHTLLGHELSAYAPERMRPWVDPLGAAIDRWIARRADAILALCEDARSALAPHARGPVEVIPPGLEPRPAPDEDAQQIACREAGVSPGRFALYAGNLDTYQELERLDAAAERLADGLPVLAATHDARDGASRYPHLRVVERADFEAVRALSFAACALVLTRRRPGGFPVKLLNYMETGRPIVAQQRVAEGLVDGTSACLLDDAAGAGEIAAALRGLQSDPARAAALGAAARDTLAARHAWPDLARRTLALAQRASRPG